ncbi:MAG: ATP-dependent sacrificial sulfur transferase LarE [Bradymonadales bacterium]|nr:ATP-dependent sacrificial sulfur transferase LarE [Bradymonadales bacterium]
MDDPLYQQLVSHLVSCGSVLVAFSGGVDSSLVLAAAHDALGDRVLAVTARSVAFPAEERQRAIETARQVGARHLLVDTFELDNPTYRANPPDRCYHCKREIFATLCAVAEKEGLDTVVDGSNADDASDHRPGARAAQELQIRSPLAELSLGKSAIRRLAQSRGLPGWDRPASACLASRIPYGQPITVERLYRMERTEAGLRDLGFRVVRLRDHGDLARIEVGPDQVAQAFDRAIREEMVQLCRQQGFTYVCLDLAGYRTGSLNEVL